MIQCTPKWKTSGIVAPQKDCVVLNTGSDDTTSGVRGVNIAQVHLLFLFMIGEEVIKCALIHEFCKSYLDPDPDNGMWIIEPDFGNNGSRIMSIVETNSVRATHTLSSQHH